MTFGANTVCSDQTNLNHLGWLLQAETRPSGALLTRDLSSFMDTTMFSVRRDLPVTCPSHVRAGLSQAHVSFPQFTVRRLFSKRPGNSCLHECLAPHIDGRLFVCGNNMDPD